jgi:hypothetical protein
LRRPDSPWLLAVLGLAGVMRVVPAIARPLQVDEAYTLHVAAMAPSQIVHVLATLDVHPPLFWFALHALLLLRAPDVLVRVLMACLGVAGVALLAFVVDTWHGKRAALVAALCAAPLPSLIFYDITIRMYALYDCLALGSFAIASVLYTRDGLSVATRRLGWVSWTVCIALLLWTQYLGFTVVAAQLLFAAVVRRDGLVRSLAGFAAALLLWSPQLSTFMQQLPGGGLAFPSYAHHELSALWELVGQSTLAVQTHGAAMFVLWTSLVAWAWLIAAVAIAAPRNMGSLAVWLLVPAGITLCYGALAHKLLFVDRYFLLFALGLCALTGIAADRLAHASTAGRWTTIAVVLVLGVFGSMYAFDPDYYTADWKAIGGLIQTQGHRGDLIVLDQGSPYFVLDRLGLVGGHPLVLVFRHGDVPQTMRLARPFRRVWLVLFQSGPVDPQAQILHDLAARYRPTGAWTFVRRLPAEGASVVRFER